MVQLKALLDSYDPRLWLLFVATTVGAVVWMFKHAAPAYWDKIPQRLQMFPATIIGGLLAASPGQSAKEVVIGTICGAFSGVMAVGGHHWWDRLISPPETAPAATQPATADAGGEPGKDRVA